MSDYTGRLACVRCGTQVDAVAPWTGCPACARDGVHANVLPTYGAGTTDAAAPDPTQPGIFRYRQRLPLAADVTPVSLAEGNTPLVPTPDLGASLGVGALWFKDETRNPTWSYKDRLAAMAITDARARGAKTVALATTGNHGAATAAYAAAAGLRCVVLTLESVPLTMKVLMQSYGAEVVALRTGPERWQLLRQAVDAWGWVPVSGFLDPPLGSNPFGIDGYKTIAFELHEQLGDVPDAVVVPSAYADGLAGVQRGFADLAELGVTSRQPRLIAVDPFGAYAAAMDAETRVLPRVAAGASVSFSIATPTATHQGVAALRASDGAAAGPFDDQATIDAQLRIARRTGLYLEASSATTLLAVEQLVARGELDGDSRVVCLATSTGLKDIATTAQRLPDVPVIDPDLDQLARYLEVSEDRTPVSRFSAEVAP
ncbi:pyridoxal-phosphate dependent enzyme [Egicoccus sp. AB-alg2]|uniref:threonine synthase n=1 Tax=Egicoccus sp. AB-alg2 TaxID=3242693 RepID=UPI00359EAD89